MIDWGKLMSDAGIPESPGRVEASEVYRYLATFMEAKAGSEHSVIIEAMSYHGALKKLKGRSKRLLSLVRIND